MSEEMLIELRFEPEAEDCFEASAAILGELGVEREGAARDAGLLAALTVAAASVSLAIELIKLARELRSKGKTSGVLVVKLDAQNREQALGLLDASEAEIQAFVTSPRPSTG